MFGWVRKIFPKKATKDEVALLRANLDHETRSTGLRLLDMHNFVLTDSAKISQIEHDVAYLRKIVSLLNIYRGKAIDIRIIGVDPIYWPSCNSELTETFTIKDKAYEVWVERDQKSPKSTTSGKKKTIKKRKKKSSRT